MPLEQGCYNGRLVMGSGVAQMALALKQLTNVKFRAAGYYPVGRSTWHPVLGQYIKANYWWGSGSISKGATDEHDLFYFSQPTSEWIGLEIVYGPSTELDVEPDGDEELRPLDPDDPMNQVTINYNNRPGHVPPHVHRAVQELLRPYFENGEGS